MQAREIAGMKVQRDAEGFFASRIDWRPEMAQQLAAEAGIALTPRHWMVINFCRADAGAHEGLSPGLRRISLQSGVGMKELYALFPVAPGKTVARIAGLPKPKSCL